ncbi:MAG: RNA methyltransferase [Desulfobacterales bacterium]|nr:RNA methyltransferase [Desulfobacterales bacterium]
MHYPVANKNGDTVASAVTNLDLHDIARAARTYGVKKFFVVTPLEDQQNLVGEIISHWTEGAGAIYNPQRRMALELITVSEKLEDVIGEIEKEHHQVPETVVTSARTEGSLGYAEFREMLKKEKPYLLLFGTGWGLTKDFMESVDYTLAPVMGRSDYNHLSVRSAVSIIFDRLLGNGQ